jgi:hypothetical protein
MEPGDGAGWGPAVCVALAVVIAVVIAAWF